MIDNNPHGAMPVGSADQYFDPAAREQAHRDALKLIDTAMVGPRTHEAAQDLMVTLLPRDFCSALHVLLSMTAAVATLYQSLDQDGRDKFDLARAKLGPAYTDDDFRRLIWDRR